MQTETQHLNFERMKNINYIPSKIIRVIITSETEKIIDYFPAEVADAYYLLSYAVFCRYATDYPKQVWIWTKCWTN
jgi:hypothetical protein